MLIIEDGTGVADADSYISVEDADAYFAKFKLEAEYAAWAALTPEEKEVKLRKVSRDLGLLFTFKSTKVDEDQALEYPRTGYVGVPKMVLAAVCEMALIALSVNPIGQLSGDGDVKIKEVEDADGDRVKTEYFESRSSKEVAALRPVTTLLKTLLASDNDSMYVVVTRG